MAHLALNNNHSFKNLANQKKLVTQLCNKSVNTDSIHFLNLFVSYIILHSRVNFMVCWYPQNKKNIHGFSVVFWSINKKINKQVDDFNPLMTN